MTKTIKIILGILVAVIILLIAYSAAVQDKVKAGNDSDSKQIADYEYQMNELRKQKEACYNNLSYSESIDAYNLVTKPCVQYDEQIMALREQADLLKAKSYELGLDMNR